jgi:hypothetical protein
MPGACLACPRHTTGASSLESLSSRDGLDVGAPPRHNLAPRRKDGENNIEGLPVDGLWMGGTIQEAKLRPNCPLRASSSAGRVPAAAR